MFTDFEQLPAAAAGYTIKETTLSLSGSVQVILKANPARVCFLASAGANNYFLSTLTTNLGFNQWGVQVISTQPSQPFSFRQLGGYVGGTIYGNGTSGNKASFTEILMTPSNPLYSSLVAAASNYSVKESSLTIGSTPSQLVGANPNRVALMLSVGSGTFFIAADQTTLSTSGGPCAVNNALAATILTFADVGPLIQQQLFAIRTSGSSVIGVTEIIYLS